MVKKEKKNSNIKTITIAVFLVALVLFYFNHLSNKSSEKKTQSQKDELDKLCDYDMLNDYPKTVRDVVKLHNRFFNVFYGQDVDDDELKTLNSNIRELYSSELCKINPESTMLVQLKKDIATMKDKDYFYKSFELQEASQIKYYNQNGQDMATMVATVTVGKGNSIGYIYVQYVLVKENEQWKILAWGETQNDQ